MTLRGNSYIHGTEFKIIIYKISWRVSIRKVPLEKGFLFFVCFFFMMQTIQYGRVFHFDGLYLSCLQSTVPHDSSRGLYGYNTSDTKIKVFWEDVPRDHQNGIITGYTLFYNTTLRSGEILHHNQSLGPHRQHELTGLLPFKYYDIQVAAFTSKGLGPRSNSTIVQTEEEGEHVFWHPET